MFNRRVNGPKVLSLDLIAIKFQTAYEVIPAFIVPVAGGYPVAQITLSPQDFFEEAVQLIDCGCEYEFPHDFHDVSGRTPTTCRNLMLLQGSPQKAGLLQAKELAK